MKLSTLKYRFSRLLSVQLTQRTNFVLREAQLVLVAVFLSIFLFGCAVSVGDRITQDLENAYIAADQNDGDQEARKDATSAAARKYFPPGMKVEAALDLLLQLKRDGFEVGEYRHNGARAWPDGEFRPYRDEDTSRNMQNQYKEGESGFTARKSYGTLSIIVRKNFVISFRVIDGSGEISRTDGNVWADSI